jgi:CheY-like chemotaxis protein
MTARMGQRCPRHLLRRVARARFNDRFDLVMCWHPHCSRASKMGRTILVVDDEPELVASCERLLQRAGHASLRAFTGAEAISLIDQEQPDLVVADYRLPETDGLAVARHARAQVPPIPVILITAYDSWQARQAAREAGVEAYLAKPFSNAEFLQAVLRILPSRPGDERGSGRV